MYNDMNLKCFFSILLFVHFTFIDIIDIPIKLLNVVIDYAIIIAYY